MDLGGLNTAYIDRVDESLLSLESIAEKLMWGRFYNTGQSRNSI